MRVVLILIAFLILNFGFHSIFSLCFGSSLAAISFLAKAAWIVSFVLPPASSALGETALLSEISGSAAKRFLLQPAAFRESVSPYASWERNQAFLAQVPLATEEDLQLVEFLERRWLAKSSGFFPMEIGSICPSFGLNVQVHPGTTNSYARDPASKISKAYEERVESWKKSLPHPADFPLVLTRPADLRSRLPSYLEYANARQCVEFAKKNGRAVVDFTRAIVASEPEAWLAVWKPLRKGLLAAARERGVEPGSIVCIQTLRQGETGGIRILPLTTEDPRPAHVLLDWISCFGLAANQVEIDRFPPSLQKRLSSTQPIQGCPIEEFSSYLEAFACDSFLPRKAILAEGTVRLLKGWVASVDSERLERVEARSAILRYSLERIRNELEQLKADGAFFKDASHIEEIHAHLSAILEIASPFNVGDFPAIYQRLLLSVPQRLKSLTFCALHSPGMASAGGILHAAAKALGRKPRVLYGENTYFECIKAVELMASPQPALNASENELREADLLIAQFNPVWKRTDLRSEGYRAEDVAGLLKRCLEAKRGESLTLALDCTLDYIDSPRVGQLLEEFQEEIQRGALNVVCYRSGLKFDLFGMDNYSGAPFFMIHSVDSKWTPFDELLTDPALLSDRLSANWFCLAYSFAAPQLELYRRQIFENTRALLKEVPKTLHASSGAYRVIPVDERADPSFIDMHIYGPFHAARAAAIAASLFYFRCMEKGHPIFYRRSLGFYHLNFGLLFGEGSSTIRLTLGLDPEEVGVLADCFRAIDVLSLKNR